ncbi:MAG TPA: hypothetical protein VN229_18240 [Terriglobales bacterium]|nr:hypothetical protein [Terriglobales bacterium]
MLTKLMQLSLSLLALGGCAYHEGQQVDINNPVVRKVGWFSYLDGNDIREACAAGGSDRYRLVYNGQYDEQIRSYEIYLSKDGSAVLNARALDNANNVVNITVPDVFSPWSWHESQAKLTPAEVDQFRGLLTASGYGTMPPQGLQLHSRDFYWVAAGCQQGVFHFYAWNNRQQSMARAGFAPIKFRDFLLQHDQTQVAFRPDHVTSPAERDGQRGGGGDRNTPKGTFILNVKGEGIGGLLNAF